LVPRAAALVAGFREILWLSPEGEIEALSPAEARARLEGETAMVCHARAVARRLDLAGFAALDLLERFAFVRPAQFCVPTPPGAARLANLGGIAGAPAPASAGQRPGLGCRGARAPRGAARRRRRGAAAAGRLCRSGRRRLCAARSARYAAGGPRRGRHRGRQDA